MICKKITKIYDQTKKLKFKRKTVLLRPIVDIGDIVNPFRHESLPTAEGLSW